MGEKVMPLLMVTTEAMSTAEGEPLPIDGHFIQFGHVTESQRDRLAEILSKYSSAHHMRLRVIPELPKAGIEM
ncbi:MAG: hypothetical protein GEV03_12840 [Streptosporangiales bacterium]|nr:hypothetical protein [Streptosporangiales bacterium]